MLTRSQTKHLRKAEEEKNEYDPDINIQEIADEAMGRKRRSKSKAKKKTTDLSIRQLQLLCDEVGVKWREASGQNRKKTYVELLRAATTWTSPPAKKQKLSNNKQQDQVETGSGTGYIESQTRMETMTRHSDTLASVLTNRLDEAGSSARKARHDWTTNDFESSRGYLEPIGNGNGAFTVSKFFKLVENTFSDKIRHKIKAKLMDQPCMRGKEKVDKVLFNNFNPAFDPLPHMMLDRLLQLGLRRMEKAGASVETTENERKRAHIEVEHFCLCHGMDRQMELLQTVGEEIINEPGCSIYAAFVDGIAEVQRQPCALEERARRGFGAGRWKNFSEPEQKAPAKRRSKPSSRGSYARQDVESPWLNPYADTFIPDGYCFKHHTVGQECDRRVCYYKHEKFTKEEQEAGQKREITRRNNGTSRLRY